MSNNTIATHEQIILDNGNKIDLSIGKAEIVIHENPVVDLIDSMGGDHSIVRAARVSVKGANEVFMGKGEKGLINYLMKEKHGSPFEHTYMTFYVKAPIMVFREFHRHRMASYNEMSGRYTQLLPEFYIPSPDRKLINVGSSARPEFAPGTEKQYYNMAGHVHESYQMAWDKYQAMLDEGIANEVARLVLPVGIYSQMYASMNLRSAFNFLSLRTHDDSAVHVSRPQREIEMVAELIENEVANLFPTSLSLFNKHGRVAP